jgi:hypothetical protein
MIVSLQESTSSMDLKLNVGKTKVMVIGSEDAGVKKIG